MRLSYASWPSTAVDWTSGLALSAPLAAALLLAADASETVRNLVALIAVVLAVPWVVPLTVAIGAASAPVYMWLHTLGPVPAVLQWLGGVVLVSAVVGAHINAAWAITRWRASRVVAEPGLREFLRRTRTTKRSET